MPIATKQEGEKKALLVGICYKSNRNLVSNGLRVQIIARKDVKNLKEPSMGTYRYEEQDIVIMINLTSHIDDGQDQGHEHLGRRQAAW
ncbi:hypothetical protein BD309DRAFT_1084940 [Dichomitus squalens]|uniref:Uncharacterized protein n=2 Tax=Dichomitus squalens TaxID=114155 RepID=A0A4Q9P9C0_9APHY|nr:uncharacterized protein DICSQDRAFT_173427 [Dichomitus squalens LYAD-421 SS1]EJF57933.1 hypothetical protein DICSQDRAFT_173427 [Dichomitus squalens LYAD-421 SS1]TBU36953.1 hypothetical protein BD309DRAFT_1084940 [Dichomitus squalens]TBU51174.1 hypothetical protein BD310DRAFT_942616 [Dichomitus squalens]